MLHDEKSASLEDGDRAPGARVTHLAVEDVLHGQVLTVQEEQLTLVEAVRLYPQAVGWSVFFSIGIIMTAFDPQLMGNLLALPAFVDQFGTDVDGTFAIAAAWQTSLLMGNPIGQVVGAFFAAYPMEWFGRKKTFIACVIMTASLIFIQFFARSLQVLLAGELIGGLVLGTYAVIAPAYASEVCPTALRGVLTSYINLCFVIGQLIANGVTDGTQSMTSHWAYSGPFASQWFWCLIVLIGSPFAPESPWYLVRKGLDADAAKALRRLTIKKDDASIQRTLDVIIETDRLEKVISAGTTYWDCFNKVNLRRTEISIGVYCMQVISGIYLVTYVTYFFELAGLSTAKAFDMSVGFLAVGFVATCISWWLMTVAGRRIIYNTGLSILIVLLLIIGILDVIPGYSSKPGLSWAQASLMIIWNFVYDLTIGPFCFVILCEISATRVRGKTIAIATACQAVLGIAMTVAIPYLINPDDANARGKIGFFFGGLALFGLVWAYFRIPESKGRSYEELDVMFARNVPTRAFKNYDLNATETLE